MKLPIPAYVFFVLAALNLASLSYLGIYPPCNGLAIGIYSWLLGCNMASGLWAIIFNRQRTRTA